MLKQIRGTMKSAVAALLAVPLVIAFAAWGVPEIRQFTQSYTVRVGKSGISALEIQTEFDRFATNQRLSGNEFDREAAIASGAHNQIVQTLAARTALDQESQKMGLSMPRDMVRNFLQTSDQFKNPRTGKFDNEALNGILREYNYGIREFEDRLQSDLLRNQLMSAIAGGEPAPKTLVDALVLRESEERTISYLNVTEDMAAPSAEPTEETLKAYYEKNASQFMAPEYRTFSAIILKNSDYAETISPSEEELRGIYEASIAKYQTPERRTVNQITFTDEESAKSAAEALKGGKPFEAVANENGKTLAEVTLLDAQKKDILDPKVADAVFSLKDEGGIVGPVKGVFGFTVAQIAAIKPAEVRPFEEVQLELAADATSKDSKKKLFDVIEEIENQRDTGASLSDAALKAGTIAFEYGPVDSYSFGSGGEIVAGVPGDVLREAFKLEEGEESDAVEFADKSGYFFVSVNEIAPPSKIAYEKVEAEIRERWSVDDRKERMAKVVKSIRDALASGKTLKEAAEPFNRAPITEAVSRRSASQKFSPAVSDQIFAADKGEAISGPAAAGNADVVLTVDHVAFDTAKVSPDDVAVFAQYVGRQIGQEIVDAYADAVVSDAGVKINQSQIDDIFSVNQ